MVPRVVASTTPCMSLFTTANLRPLKWLARCGSVVPVDDEFPCPSGSGRVSSFLRSTGLLPRVSPVPSCCTPDDPGTLPDTSFRSACRNSPCPSLVLIDPCGNRPTEFSPTSFRIVDKSTKAVVCCPWLLCCPDCAGKVPVREYSGPLVLLPLSTFVLRTSTVCP